MKRIIAVLSAVILTASVILSVVSATVGNVEKTLLYDGIRITLEGEEIKPCDVNGNYIEPFIIEGTTYLPVRGIANSLGLTVGWDEKTKTVKLNEPANKTELLFDSRKIKLSFKKYEYTAEGDLKVRFRIENKNIDNITLNIYNVSVNGYMIPNVGAEIKVATGKNSDVNLVIEAEKLEENNITYVKEIELIADITEFFSGEKYLREGIISITADKVAMSEKAPRPEKDYSQEFAYEEFVDFIKKNGSNIDGTYNVSHAFAVKDNDGGRPSLVNISLEYSDGEQSICLKAFMNHPSVDMKSDSIYMGVILSPNAASYNFYAKVLSSEIDISGKIPANKSMFDPNALTIDDKIDVKVAETDKIILKDWQLYGINVTFTDDFAKNQAATAFSELLSFISNHGDGLFEKYGSDLTFKYFGM